jgi:hypothetical protein
MKKVMILAQIVLMFSLAINTNCLGQNTQPTDMKSFSDTTGNNGFIYLTMNCFECFPRNLSYYKKFAIVSGVYKVRDFYSLESTRTIAHFRKQIEDQKYFIDKSFQVWKSPEIYYSIKEAEEARNELVAKLNSEQYKLIQFEGYFDAKKLPKGNE